MLKALIARKLELVLLRKKLLPLLSGIVLALSFPIVILGKSIPNLAFLAWVGLLPLLFSIHGSSLKGIFQKSFVFGIVFSSFSLSWIYSALHHSAGYSSIASLACLGFVVFMIALYIGLAFTSAIHINRRTKFPLFLVLPLAWIFFEYLTNFFPLGGFPWINLGYSQQRYLYLIQSADIFGVLGISFLIITVNVLIYEGIRLFVLNEMRLARRSFVVVAILLIVNLTYGVLRIAQVEHFNSNNQAIKIIGIPGHISQKEKWDPKYSESIIERYKTLTLEAADLGPDMIVWPETAIPYHISRDLKVMPSNIVPSLSSPILLGSMTLFPKDMQKQWNSALLVEQDNIRNSYDKTHLVPLGEYIPDEFPFIKYAFASDIDTEPGKKFKLFYLNGIKFGVQICFEDIFPPLTRRWVVEGAKFIVNLSNDGWYAKSSGILQHRAHSIFRSIENRVSFIRVANQGISTVVSPSGKVLEELDTKNGSKWFNASLIPYHTFSLYTFWGDVPIWIAIFFFTALLILSLIKVEIKTLVSFFKSFRFKKFIPLYKYLIVIVILIIPMTARSQTSSNAYTPFQYYSNGEAVNLADGSLNLSYTDLVLPGKGGMDVEITRSYVSPRSTENRDVVIDKSIFTGYENPKKFTEIVTFEESTEEPEEPEEPENKVLGEIVKDDESSTETDDIGTTSTTEGTWKNTLSGTLKYPVSNDKYYVGENINAHLVCAALNYGLWGDFLKKDSERVNTVGCEAGSMANIEQFRMQEISENELQMEISTANNASELLDHRDKRYFQEYFLGTPQEMNFKEEIYPLGAIKSNGDNLVWTPPNDTWIFAGGKYVAAVVFRNVMPFSRMDVENPTEMMVFLLKADGSYDVFDKTGRRMGYTDGYNQRALEFYSGNDRVDTPMQTADDFFSTNAFAQENLKKGIGITGTVELIKSAFPVSLVYNDAHKLNLDRLILNEIDGGKYIFNRFKKYTIYSQLMTKYIDVIDGCSDGSCESGMGCKCPNGGAGPKCCSIYTKYGIYFYKNRIDHIPHWDISLYMLSEERDEHDHSITYDHSLNSYQKDYWMRIKDTVDRNIDMSFDPNNIVYLQMPNNKKWGYHYSSANRIGKIIDPAGRETTIRYSPAESNLPLVRHWNFNQKVPDTFVEIRYPSGGVMRYEAVKGYGDIAHSEILTTEFPDDRDASIYYQKYITIDRSENEGIVTKIYKSDGSVYKYIHKIIKLSNELSDFEKVMQHMKYSIIFSVNHFDKIPLLIRRELNPGQANAVVDDYTWKISKRDGREVVDGLEKVITTEKGVSFEKSYTYDDSGRVSSYTDELGNIITFKYDDAQGIKDPILADSLKQIVRKVTRTKRNADGGKDTIEIIYHSTGADICSGAALSKRKINRISVRLNAQDEEIIKEYCFDADGNIVKETNLDNSKDEFEYYKGTFLHKIKNESGETTLTYDENIGKLISIADQDGRTINYKYNDVGQLTRVDYPNNSYVAHQYGERYRLDNSTQENKISTDIFDSARNQHRITTRYFDGINRLTLLKKGENETRYSYGQNKMATTIVFPGEKRYNFKYDGLDRVRSITYPGGKDVTYSYEPTTLNNSFVHKLDILYNGQLYATHYRDAKDKVIRSVQYPGGNLSPVTTDYQFDEFENLIKIKSPEGMITKNTYDHYQRLKGRVYPNGDKVEMNNISNENGLLDSLVLQDSVLGSVTAKFNYDTDHRLTNVDYPGIGGGELNDYKVEYADQHVSAIIDAFGRTEFKYSPDGILNKISQDIPGTELSDSIQYGEDGFGTTYWIGYPDGTIVYYLTDDHGRVSEIRMGSTQGKLIAEIGYDDSGNLQKIKYGNGIVNSYTYDSFGKVIEIQIARENEIINQLTYTYDMWGNKSSMTYLDGSKVEFKYDGLKQLIEARYFRPEENTPYNIQSYSYDGDGNRISYSDAYKNEQYEYTTGMMTKVRVGSQVERSQKYDIRGNLIDEVEKKAGKESFHKTFEYDFQDRLTKTTLKDEKNSNLNLEFTYDYASRRTEKKVNGKTKQYYIYGKSTEPMVEFNGKGEIERLFIYLGGRRIAAFENEEFQFNHLDEMANLIHTTDDKGRVTETLRYDPFGNVNFRLGLTKNKYLFNSKEYDNETGLFYYGARYYDAKTGRFITRDPMEDGINHYIFARNNALCNEEYMGMGSIAKKILKVVIGVVTGTLTAVITGNPSAGLYVGLVAAGGMLSQEFASGGSDAYVVSFSYTGSSPDIDDDQGWRGRIGINSGTTPSHGQPIETGEVGNNGCMSNRLCISIGNGGTFVSTDGGNSLYNAKLGSRYSGGGFGNNYTGTSGNGDGSSGALDGGASNGYGLGFDISMSSSSSFSPINTNPLNSSNQFPSYNDVYGNSVTSDIAGGTSFTNIGLPVSSPVVAANPVNRTFEPFHLSSSEDTFTGRGSTPPPPTTINMPLGFNQQDDTPIALVQGAMQNITANNTVADPVMLFSGDLLQVATDLKIPGRGIDYEFKRTYRSRLDYDGPLGYGWDHNYNMRLVEMDAGLKIRRFDGDARYDDYTLKANRYVAPAGRFDRLIKRDDGTYQIRDSHGTIYEYRTDGFISSIKDRNQNQLTFQYTKVGDETVLDSVTDSLGRVIDYQYNAPGKLTSIIDFSGRTVRFDYNDKGDLIAVHSPIVDGYPDGKITRYKYSDEHNLLTVTDPAGQTYLKNEYSSTDRVVKQYLGSKAFDFTYYRKREFYTCTPESDPSMEVSRTTVIDRNGNQKGLSFNCQGNPLKVTEFTRGMRFDDPASFVTSYTYNLDGLVTSETKPEGNRTEYRYQNMNTGEPAVDKLYVANRIEERKIPDSVRGGSPLITKYAYEPVYNQIKEITEPGNATSTFHFDYQENSTVAILAAKMGVTENIAQTLLTGLTISMGDINDDQKTNQIAGNMLRKDLPAITRADGTVELLSYRYQYNQFGQRTVKEDPDSSRDEYQYDNSGYLAKVIQGAGKENVVNLYEHDSVGNITAFVDGNSNRYEYTINPLNQVVAEKMPSTFNIVRTIKYDGNDNPIQIDEPNLDDKGNPIDGNPTITTQLKYDMLNRLTARTQEVAQNKNVLTEYRYDANENLTRIIQPEGNSIAIKYDERDLPYQTTHGFGSQDASTFTIAYDGNKNRIAIEDGEGNEAKYIYDGFDRLIQEIDASGSKTEYSYNDRGDRTAILKKGKPDGQSSTEVSLQNISLLYDEIGRLVQKEEAVLDAGTLTGKRTTKYEYSGNNQISKLVDALGNSTTYTYDGLDRVTKSIDPKGNEIETTYDDNGNISKQISREVDDITNTKVEYASSIIYDSLNHPVTLTDNLGHMKQHRYDSRGNLLYTSDSNDTLGVDLGPNQGEGNITRFSYDGLGRLIQQIQELTDNGAGSGSKTGEIVTKYAWDTNSRLASITDAKNHTTEFTYDALNRRIKTIMADGSAYQSKYDRNSNVIETQDPAGFIVNFVYDSSNYLTQKRIELGSTYIGSELFEYNGVGNMVKAVNMDDSDQTISTVLQTYDSLGNLLKEEQNGKSVTSKYDIKGRRERLTYPSGKVLNFTHDTIDRVTNIDDTKIGKLSQMTWINRGQVGKMEYLNGTSVTKEYDKLKRTIKHINQFADQSIIAGFESAYDKADNRLYDDFVHNANKGNAYSYDSLSRLTQVAYDLSVPKTNFSNPQSGTYSTSEAFAMDSLHNWVTKTKRLDSQDPTKKLTTTFISNDMNAYLTAVTTETAEQKDYHYDVNGNMKDDDRFKYTYDYRNYLIEVKDKATDQQVASYQYDALGRRISKSVSNVTTTFIYDGVNVIEEQVGGKTSATFTSLPLYKGELEGVGVDSIISMERDNNIYYYHTDTSGNIVALTDSKGALVERYSYSAYGEVEIHDAGGALLAQSGVDNPYLYAGREYDPETNLYYNRARTYNPELGRFMQQDPLGFVDSLNRYAYVMNNPINFVDPFGLARMAGGATYNGDVMQYLSDWTNEAARISFENAQRSTDIFSYSLNTINHAVYGTANFLMPTQEEMFAIAASGGGSVISYGASRMNFATRSAIDIADNAWLRTAPIILNAGEKILSNYLQNSQTYNQVAKGVVSGVLAGLTDQKTGLPPTSNDAISYWVSFTIERYVEFFTSIDLSKDMIKSYINENNNFILRNNVSEHMNTIQPRKD
ncbi:MAG: apolipoprotein N-acyltransferase [Pseudomonadota bacterium]